MSETDSRSTCRSGIAAAVETATEGADENRLKRKSDKKEKKKTSSSDLKAGSEERGEEEEEEEGGSPLAGDDALKTEAERRHDEFMKRKVSKTGFPPNLHVNLEADSTLS